MRAIVECDSTACAVFALRGCQDELIGGLAAGLLALVQRLGLALLGPSGDRHTNYGIGGLFTCVGVDALVEGGALGSAGLGLKGFGLGLVVGVVGLLLR